MSPQPALRTAYALPPERTSTGPWCVYGMVCEIAFSEPSGWSTLNSKVRKVSGRFPPSYS